MTALVNNAAMSDSPSPTRPPEEQLLALQQKLWKLTNALLLPASSTSRPTSSASNPTSSPASLLAQLRACQHDIDTIWATHAAQRAVHAKDTEAAAKAGREGLRAGLREGYLAYAMEVFADELDALRQDASFQGTEEDVKGIIAMLEEGVEALWEGGREGGKEEEEGLRVYRDTFLGQEEEDGSEAKEPVHLRRRRLMQQQQQQQQQRQQQQQQQQQQEQQQEQQQQQRHREEGGATPMEEGEEEEEELEKEKKRKEEKKDKSKKKAKVSPIASRR